MATQYAECISPNVTDGKPSFTEAFVQMDSIGNNAFRHIEANFQNTNYLLHIHEPRYEGFPPLDASDLVNNVESVYHHGFERKLHEARLLRNSIQSLIMASPVESDEFTTAAAEFFDKKIAPRSEVEAAQMRGAPVDNIEKRRQNHPLIINGKEYGRYGAQGVDVMSNGIVNRTLLDAISGIDIGEWEAAINAAIYSKDYSPYKRCQETALQNEKAMLYMFYHQTQSEEVDQGENVYDYESNKWVPFIRETYRAKGRRILLDFTATLRQLDNEINDTAVVFEIRKDLLVLLDTILSGASLDLPVTKDIEMGNKSHWKKDNGENEDGSITKRMQMRHINWKLLMIAFQRSVIQIMRANNVAEITTEELYKLHGLLIQEGFWSTYGVACTLLINFTYTDVMMGVIELLTTWIKEYMEGSKDLPFRFTSNPKPSSFHTIDPALLHTKLGCITTSP